MKRANHVLIIGVWAAFSALVGFAAEDDAFKTIDGLAVYLGVLPAAMVQGHETHPEEKMHGGVPRGRHAYHVLAAVFDAATGERVEDATVMARVTPRGLASETRELEAMRIADTVTYGNYFTMAGADPYRIQLTISRVGASTPVDVEFVYEHGVR